MRQGLVHLRRRVSCSHVSRILSLSKASHRQSSCEKKQSDTSETASDKLLRLYDQKSDKLLRLYDQTIGLYDYMISLINPRNVFNNVSHYACGTVVHAYDAFHHRTAFGCMS